ncbi:MAG: START-like domain-containing protein [Catalinimonas sp.]
MENTTQLRFEREFEMEGEPKALYPFLIADYGLSRWFADKVEIDPEQERQYTFYWQQQAYPARLVARRPFKYVRFEFEQEGGKLALLEFTVETNAITQETYLRVVDETSTGDEEEVATLWDNLIEELRASLAA